MTTDHYAEMQKILAEDIQLCHLNGIIETRKEWANIAHHNGKYGSAKEYALTSSLARQLKQIYQSLNKLEDSMNGKSTKTSDSSASSETSA